MGIRTLALAGTAAVLLTACTGTGPSGTAVGPTFTAPPLQTAPPSPPPDPRTGAEVLQDAVDALREAGAVRAEGTFMRNGAKAAMDVHLQDDGAAGTFSIGRSEIDVVVIGDEAYARATAAFWRTFGLSPAVASRVGESWLLMPVEDAAALGPLSMPALVDEMLTPEAAVLDEVGDGRVYGRWVRIVTTEDGDTMSVLGGPDSYPVDIRTGTPRSATLLQFTDVGERQELEAPPDFVPREDLGP